MNRISISFIAAAIVTGGLAGSDVAVADHRPAAPVCPSYRTNDQYPIRLCDKGPAVLVAQAFLWAFEHNLQIDGYFGPQTDGAVRSYQSHNGLNVDGLIGPRTGQALTSSFTCGTDDDHSGVVDPDEIDRSPADFPDFYAFLVECFGAKTVN